MPSDKKEIRFYLLVILLFLLIAGTIWLVYDHKISKLEQNPFTTLTL